jgi:hypothetical protein
VSKGLVAVYQFKIILRRVEPSPGGEFKYLAAISMTSMSISRRQWAGRIRICISSLSMAAGAAMQRT